MKFFADLKTVAFSGSYNDLSNKPSIPKEVAVKGNAESAYRTGNVNLTPANLGALATNGDSKSNTVTFTSNDASDSNVTKTTGWTTVTALASGITHATFFQRVSQMFKNVRYLYKLIGTTDISAIGDGTVKGAISTLNSNLIKIEVLKCGISASANTDAIINCDISSISGTILAVIPINISVGSNLSAITKAIPLYYSNSSSMKVCSTAAQNVYCHFAVFYQ